MNDQILVQKYCWNKPVNVEFLKTKIKKGFGENPVPLSGVFLMDANNNTLGKVCGIGGTENCLEIVVVVNSDNKRQKFCVKDINDCCLITKQKE